MEAEEMECPIRVRTRVRINNNFTRTEGKREGER